MSTVIASVGSSPPREVSGDLGPAHDLRYAKDIVIHGAVDRSLVLAGGALAIEGRAGGSTLTAGTDMTLLRAHSCEITAAGTLWILGSGATDCDIDVAGDLIGAGPQSAIRSGLVQVGGRLQVGELAGREGARLRVVMTGARATEELVAADVVHPGVEIVACGELLRFDRRHDAVRISVHDGRARLTST